LNESEKAVDLYRRLVIKHTKKRELVLDFFAGSGACALACIATGRRYKGCEKDVAKRNDAWVRVVRFHIFSQHPDNAKLIKEPDGVADAVVLASSGLLLAYNNIPPDVEPEMEVDDVAAMYDVQVKPTTAKGMNNARTMGMGCFAKVNIANKEEIGPIFGKWIAPKRKEKPPLHCNPPNTHTHQHTTRTHTCTHFHFLFFFCLAILTLHWRDYCLCCSIGIPR
jgi:hypothetical protein